MPENIYPVSENKYRRRFTLFAIGLACFIIGTLVGGTFLARDAARLVNHGSAFSCAARPGMDLAEFWTVWDKIKEKYVNQPIDTNALFHGSIEGMVAGLGDPYSVYFPPKKAEEFSRDLSGKFEGIGAEIGMQDNSLIIIAPLSGSPAEAAGLKPKDIIVMIDGVDAHGLSTEEAVAKIRGPQNTSVKLTVSRNAGVPFTVSIKRAKIMIPSVVFTTKDNNTAYIRISYFNETTGAEFDKIVSKVLATKPHGIILDMRSNPGGYLDRSVHIASEWIPDGVIVSEKFLNKETNEYKSEGRHRFAGIPTIVLVDDSSASAAEIVAGALQDYGVAKLVGEKTFGKGSVQDYEQLPDGGALKLTVAKWYTPKDRQIDKIGIMPDVTVPVMFTTSTASGNTTTPAFVDEGLKKALELLR